VTSCHESSTGTLPRRPAQTARSQRFEGKPWRLYQTQPPPEGYQGFRRMMTELVQLKVAASPRGEAAAAAGRPLPTLPTVALERLGLLQRRDRNTPCVLASGSGLTRCQIFRDGCISAASSVRCPRSHNLFDRLPLRQ